jgi:hypothetical protein
MTALENFHLPEYLSLPYGWKPTEIGSWQGYV